MKIAGPLFSLFSVALSCFEAYAWTSWSCTASSCTSPGLPSAPPPAPCAASRTTHPYRLTRNPQCLDEPSDSPHTTTATLSRSTATPPPPLRVTSQPTLVPTARNPCNSWHHALPSYNLQRSFSVSCAVGRVIRTDNKSGENSKERGQKDKKIGCPVANDSRKRERSWVHRKK